MVSTWLCNFLTFYISLTDIRDTGGGRDKRQVTNRLKTKLVGDVEVVVQGNMTSMQIGLCFQQDCLSSLL